MLFVKLEDTSGSTEIIVFPSVYKMAPQLWEPDRPIVVEGKISSKDGVPKIIANRAEVVMNQTVARIKEDFGRIRQMQTVATPLAPLKIFSLQIPASLSRETVANLRAVFAKYPGDAVVELAYVENGRTRKVRTSYSVSLSDEFSDEIGKILKK